MSVFVLPLGATVFVVPVGAEKDPTAWWRAKLLRVDSSCPRGSFLVRSEAYPESSGQWVSSIVVDPEEA
jgi:hypothetical protein